MKDLGPLESWFAVNRGWPCDLNFGGRIFGGRYGESRQVPRSYTWRKGALCIRFSTTEKLKVEDPAGLSICRGDLVISDAALVSWSWHYYGRPQIPHNLCIETYRRDGDMVRMTRSGPLSKSESWALAAEPLVAIQPMQVPPQVVLGSP